VIRLRIGRGNHLRVVSAVRSRYCTLAVAHGANASVRPDSSSAAAFRELRVGSRPQAAMRNSYKRNIVIMGADTGDSLGRCASHSDPSVRDRWGSPGAHLGNVHPHTFEIGEVQARRAEPGSRKAGAISTKLSAGRPTMVGAGQHQAGTCRMGNDPELGRDRNCRIHDVDNVFVIDSSVNVTNGGFNPALTIMALAYFGIGRAGSQLEGHGFRS